MLTHSSVRRCTTYALVILILAVEIVQAIEKLQKRCIIKFAEQDMRIICTGDSNEGGIQVWSCVLNATTIVSCSTADSIPRSIKVTSLFTKYHMISNSNNEITISVSTDGLLAALRSASAPTSGQGSSNVFATTETQVLMKYLSTSFQWVLYIDNIVYMYRLTKNQEKRSVLSFEISSTNSMGRTMNVTQQLTIDIVRRAEVDRLTEPMCPEPDVSAVQTRGVFSVDHMRSKCTGAYSASTTGQATSRRGPPAHAGG